MAYNEKLANMTRELIAKRIRMWKKQENIPYKLIEELVSKFTPDEWIGIFEKNMKR